MSLRHVLFKSPLWLIKYITTLKEGRNEQVINLLLSIVKLLKHSGKYTIFGL